MSGKFQKRLRNILIVFVILILAVGGFFAWAIFAPNAVRAEKETFLYIPNGAVYSDVLDSLKARSLLRHPDNFNEIARFFNYPKRVIAGRYALSLEMSNFELIRLLKSGRQTPVRLVINKERTKSDVAQLLSSWLEPDSAAFMQVLDDSAFLQSFGLDTNNAVCAIIPNTYQFFWNTSAKSTFERLKKERDKFWTPERSAEADSLGLDLNEVYILASIVEEETNQQEEKPLIAGVYLNRLHRGMRLQADPTLKFALKNFSLRRISGAALQVQSPYNTYLYPGLPPGPICTPSIKTIDAVLHAPETSYLYFSAKPDFSGFHVFAKTYSEHLRNARAYHKALNKLNIH